MGAEALADGSVFGRRLRGTTAAADSAAWRATSGSTLVYVSAVITMVECPSISETVFRSAPPAKPVESIVRTVSNALDVHLAQEQHSAAIVMNVHAPSGVRWVAHGPLVESAVFVSGPTSS